MSDKSFLDRVYKLETVDDTRDLYDDWAESYDAEVQANGYITPERIAETLARHLTDQTQAILDFGCGTGISGTALAGAGFSTIDGCDLSTGMLAHAKGTGAYTRLWQADPAAPFPVAPGDYAAIVACGVISKGAAPPEAMDMLIAALAPGGLLVFSFNDHTFEDPRFETKVTEQVTQGRARLLSREAGPHLPGIGLGSTIFVLERV